VRHSRSRLDALNWPEKNIIRKNRCTKKDKMLKTYKVDSWEELRAKVNEAHSTLGAKNEEVWYRGVNSSKYRLLPSLLRCFKEKEPDPEDVRELEANLFFEFLAKARTAETPALDHWDVLFLMQHYGAPTRLLDWTEVLYVALYFAVANSKSGEEQTPRLYIMNPYALNEEHTGERDLYWPRYFGYDKAEDYFYEYGEILVEGGVDWKYPVALYPPQRSARLSAQRGFFTIHGHDPRPLDQIAPKLVMAIDLTTRAVQETKEALEHSGMNEYALFPDLDGLARQLKKKYGIG
jgi:FRG domain